MGQDIPWEPDGAGSAGREDAGTCGFPRDPLALVCEHVNFADSLVRDAHRLRGRVLDVLTDIGISREQMAERLERSAAALGPGVPKERLRVAAARARTNLDGARRRWRALAAIDVARPGLGGPGRALLVDASGSG
ncbi:hypothetical protein ACFPK1_29245 [Actinomycetospora rhizophila]|uniref:Uncharacterized protein n=1 Tax=Actinomycetospora rhizophila TaxID=1416876 RepID=A0ABV9ZM65_9PSEU